MEPTPRPKLYFNDAAKSDLIQAKAIPFVATFTG
jgi:hypothetical protein